MTKRDCVYISIPDPAYEHENYINCSRLGTHVYKEYCLNCDHYLSLSDSLKRKERFTMTVKDARNTGFIGRFTPVRIYDIRSDGYLQDHSYFMKDLTHEFDNYEIYHINLEYDNVTDRAYICIDIRRNDY